MSVTEEEGEAEEQTEQQPGSSQDSSEKVFKVTCSDLAGTLHQKRFASGNYISLYTNICTFSGYRCDEMCSNQLQNVSPLNVLSPPGTCGKSIRTETSWMTPVEFTKEASCQADASWKKHIKWEEKPLSVLIEVTVVGVVS